MPVLLLGMLRAFWALRRDGQFRSLALLTVLAIVSGTGFYSIVEGFRFVDAVYFSVVSLTTVGYGDLAPETDAGKLFTAVYVLVGVGILLAFVTALAARMTQTTLLPHRRPARPAVSTPARITGRAEGEGAARQEWAATSRAAPRPAHEER
jgi:voltage-gated potassium channel